MSHSEDLSADEDLSSDEEEVQPQAKRAKINTIRTSERTTSTSSHDSGETQDSDDEEAHVLYNNSDKRNNVDQSPFQTRNSRLSRSSISENCSSPNEPCDYYRSGFDDIEAESNAYSTPSFQMDDSPKGNRANDALKEMNDVYKNTYSDKAKQMMTNMGFKAGHGLGKNEHGRVEPVEASTQKGRRGLGMKPSIVGEIPSDFSWTPDDTAPEAKEEVLWMPTPPEETLSIDELESWLKKGKKKTTIDDEFNFVAPQILNGVLHSKTIFDKLDDEEMRNARFRSNPYETIGSVIFLNRAAVKMANMDAVFDFMFTDPKKPDGEPALDKHHLLYFADVCAGPGGFSEYVLYRKGWRAKGFGFTLRSSNDFKLFDFFAGTPETFYPYYGVKNDGNIFDPANLMSLKDHVLSNTDDKGVHFLMGDGGFSVEGQENIQEILSKQLYLCQCLAALMLVRTGGHFVVKLFDIFTPFSVGLIYIMYRCFERVSIHKPVTSRPANSERYLICKWKKLGTEAAEQHLFSVNSIIWNERDPNSDTDVMELVPMKVLKSDTAFYEYIYNSNCMLGERQIRNLLKIAAFSKDKNLTEPSQQDMRKQCLELWNIPNASRSPPPKKNHDETLTYILSNIKNTSYKSYNTNSFKSNVLNKPPEYLEKKPDLKKIDNVLDWHFTYLSTGRNKNRNMSLDKDMIMTMFVGCGGKQVYQLKSNGTWESVENLNVELPAKTLLYGEIIKEYTGERTSQRFNRALHVIDGVMLGGIDISSEPLSERIQQCALLCAALENTSSNTQIRCKRFYGMEEFSKAVCNLEYRHMKRFPKAITITVPKRNDMFYVVGSVLFMKEIKEPWSTHISKSKGCKYYYRFVKGFTPVSEYEIKEEAAVDAISAYSGRLMWSWHDEPTAIFEGHAHDGISRKDMEYFIRSKTKIH